MYSINQASWWWNIANFLIEKVYLSWLPELTARVDGWPVSITRQHGPCWLVMEAGRPSTQAVNSGSGNRALVRKLLRVLKQCTLLVADGVLHVSINLMSMCACRRAVLSVLLRRGLRWRRLSSWHISVRSTFSWSWLTWARTLRLCVRYIYILYIYFPFYALYWIAGLRDTFHSCDSLASVLTQLLVGLWCDYYASDLHSEGTLWNEARCLSIRLSHASHYCYWLYPDSGKFPWHKVKVKA